MGAAGKMMMSKDRTRRDVEVPFVETKESLFFRQWRYPLWLNREWRVEGAGKAIIANKTRRSRASSGLLGSRRRADTKTGLADGGYNSLIHDTRQERGSLRDSQQRFRSRRA